MAPAARLRQRQERREAGEALRSLSARKDLNALACVDLTMPGASPTPALKEYVGKVPDLRVLVCGGDGTVAWVLQALEELTEVRSRVTRTINPLGPALGKDVVFPFAVESPQTLGRPR